MSYFCCSRNSRALNCHNNWNIIVRKKNDRCTSQIDQLLNVIGLIIDIVGSQNTILIFAESEFFHFLLRIVSDSSCPSMICTGDTPM